MVVRSASLCTRKLGGIHGALSLSLPSLSHPGMDLDLARGLPESLCPLSRLYEVTWGRYRTQGASKPKNGCILSRANDIMFRAILLINSKYPIVMQ